jgi:hypothetical protein
MVMKTFELNATGWVIDFLDQYQTWKDYNNFYHPAEKILDIKNSANGIPCIVYTDVDAVNRCDAPVVAIDCVWEGKHAAFWFQQYRTDKHYIIFANEGYCDQDQMNLPISYTWITYYFFLANMAKIYNDARHVCFYHDSRYQFDSPKSLRFISTVGVPRPPRTYLKDRLLERINYKNFIFKYSGVDFGLLSDQFDVIKFAPGEFDPHMPRPGLEKYSFALPSTLPIHMYNQADFNLVVESDINYQHGFFPTEKIFKCLLAGMPFVLVSTPYFLKYLKELGFYTYGELWDESYDDELDHTKRIDKIVDLCNNLDSFDWVANRSELELIALKNRSNFLNVNQVMDRGFRKFEQSILELVA